MIEFDRVTITYTDATAPTLHDVSLHIPDGELCVVVGGTGLYFKALGKVVKAGRSPETHVRYPIRFNS